jgi:hypothetical protein
MKYTIYFGPDTRVAYSFILIPWNFFAAASLLLTFRLHIIVRSQSVQRKLTKWAQMTGIGLVFWCWALHTVSFNFKEMPPGSLEPVKNGLPPV